MGKSSRNKKRAIENLNFFYQDIGTSSSAGGHLTQEEAAKEALAIRMSRKQVELDRKIVKEEEEVVKRIKGEALKEKEDPGAFIFPIRLEGQVGVTTLIAKFLILDIPIDRDSPIVVGRGFLRTIGGIVNTPDRLFSTFDGFCHQTFRAARSDGSYTKEEEATRQWRTEIRLTDPYGNIYLQGFTTKKIDRKLSKYHKLSDIMSPNLWEHTMMKPDHHDSNALDNMKLWKRYCFHKFIASSCYRKDVAEMQSLVCADDELQTKKIIKFRLGGRAHSLTLLEFARRLGDYQAVELEEEGFNVYFKEGLHSDEHFNAQDYWLSISREENLGLSRSYATTIRNPILRVIQKMITYGLCQRTTGYDKRKGAGTRKESQICYRQFISKIARKCRVLTEVVVRSLSALIYCRDMDTITLRDLIDSEGKLIPEDPQLGVPRVGIPRPPKASMNYGVFEHMAGVYSVPLHRAYNPHGFAQPQYDQYYHQYPPSPPQQQHDDDE
ncbi:hypothetical protein Tco_0474860 [Tanacetum coccineum]